MVGSGPTGWGPRSSIIKCISLVDYLQVGRGGRPAARSQSRSLFQADFS